MAKHSFLTDQFGLTVGSGGSKILTADPKAVEWADGKPVHPDEIDKIYCYGKPCKPSKKRKIALADGSTAYTLWFSAPYNKLIRYSAVVDSNGVPLE